LRWGTPEDAEALAAFNLRIHSDNPDEPEVFLTHWTRDLMRGEHPTTKASDFTLVVDEKEGGKIVSSMNLIGQTWTYGGIPFAVGRPELVGTDEAYRRRGLVRAQFATIHALSAAKGQMVQGITGIPWYYRQFGYEMTVNLDGGRKHPLDLHKEIKPAEAEEAYRIRPALADDIPLLTELYGAFCAPSLLSRLRDEQIWRYEMVEAHRESAYARHFYVIETAEGAPVAYAEYYYWNRQLHVREFAALPGHSWRAAALFLLRHLTRKAAERSASQEKSVRNIVFHFGSDHPVYDALARELPITDPPYCWYMRVADLPGFLQHIAPVLERRLAESIMAGHSGTLKLNLYRQRLALRFEAGKLAEIGDYEGKRLEEGDAAFPEFTFLHLLFGHRSLAELRYIFVDCWANEEATVLLPILFPKRPSHLIELG
jgi:hypothetical protein